MDRLETLAVAQSLLDAYRILLRVDPIVKVNIQISDDGPVSKCSKDSVSALTWNLDLNPSRHSDILDVQYSVVDALVIILMEEFDFIDADSRISDVKKRLATRLTLSLCDLLPAEIDADEESE